MKRTLTKVKFIEKSSVTRQFTETTVYRNRLFLIRVKWKNVLVCNRTCRQRKFTTLQTLKNLSWFYS